MRDYRNYGSYRNYNAVSLSDRIVSGLTYLTSGLVGFIWLIISHIRGQSLASFTRFNIFQSIFISILLYLGNIVFNILMTFVGLIPFIGPFINNVVYLISGYPLILGYSALNFAIVALYFYLAFMGFTGRYGEVPWVSDTVKRMV